jgi:hypothetical protein
VEENNSWKKSVKPGAVAYTYNPSYSGGLRFEVNPSKKLETPSGLAGCGGACLPSQLWTTVQVGLGKKTLSKK